MDQSKKEIINTCKTCYFFIKETLNNDGSCHRFPPVPIVIQGEDAFKRKVAQITMQFPIVQPSAFCGEHVERIREGMN